MWREWVSSDQADRIRQKVTFLLTHVSFSERLNRQR